MPSQMKSPRAVRSRQLGFSFIELLATTGVMLAVGGVAMSGMIQMSLTQGTIMNRSDMHGSVRSATELLQQEIGQAGRVAIPALASLAAAITTVGSNTVGITSAAGAAGMFVGQQLIIDVGQTDANDPSTAKEETITLTAVDLANNTITAIFSKTHSSGVPVRAEGAFASGIVPTTATNGSTGSILKLYGDINDDGNMVYVEYSCDFTAGNLYRNVMSVTALPPSPAPTTAQVLLPNIQPNPDGTPCFTYQQKVVPGSGTFVTNVAVTMTVRTELRDPKTGVFQTETKALLNVAPRNIFEGWQMASGGVKNRIQPMPGSVSQLLP